MNFAKFLGTPFLQNTSGRVLLVGAIQYFCNIFLSIDFIPTKFQLKIISKWYFTDLQSTQNQKLSLFFSVFLLVFAGNLMIYQGCVHSMHKKLSFPLSISSVNADLVTFKCDTGLKWVNEKLHFLCSDFYVRSKEESVDLFLVPCFC